MKKLRKILLAVATLCAAGNVSTAQERPIGYWKSFLPYNNAIGVATSGGKLFTIGTQGFYVFDAISGQLDAYSKVEGMSDLGMQSVGYDMATSMAILCYANGNIDLFKDNTFYNIPELKIKSIAGAKTIYTVYTHNGLAYLSTSLGIIVLDLTKRTIKETYEFSQNNKSVAVRSTTIKGDSLFAVTAAGIYRADVNSSALQNYQSWERIDTSGSYWHVATVGGSLFLSNDTVVYKMGAGGRSEVYKSLSSIEHLDASDANVYLSEYDTADYVGRITILGAAGEFVDSVGLPGKHPRQVVRNTDGSLWVAEEFGGLMKCNQQKEIGYFTPTGPSNFNTFDLEAHNGDLWIAHGGYDDKFRGFGRFNAFSHYQEGKWEYLERFVYRPFDDLKDFCNIEIDKKTNVRYMGSFESGLFVQNPDATYQLYNVNSVLEGSPNIGPDERQVIGMKLDERGNLWLAELNHSGNQLYVRTPEDQWYKYRVNNVNFGGPLLIDDENRVWFVASGGGGVACPNDTTGTTHVFLLPPCKPYRIQIGAYNECYNDSSFAPIDFSDTTKTNLNGPRIPSNSVRVQPTVNSFPTPACVNTPIGFDLTAAPSTQAPRFTSNFSFWALFRTPCNSDSMTIESLFFVLPRVHSSV